MSLGNYSFEGCYEPGKYVRVTVGIKPETMQVAGSTEATSKGHLQAIKIQLKHQMYQELRLIS